MTKVMLAQAITLTLVGIVSIVGVFLPDLDLRWRERAFGIGIGLLMFVLANGIMELRETALHFNERDTEEG